MPKSQQITVLLVDDHPVVRDGYRRLLEQEADIKVVAEASTGEEACKLYATQSPRVVILDMNLPGISGLETIQRLIAKDPAARILIFSMYDSRILVQRALKSGAAGYLSKSGAATQMIEAIRQVAKGKPYLEPELITAATGLSAGDAEPLNQLTKREFQIFCEIAEGHSIAEIADKLCISPKTAGVHQTNIMNKLELKNTAELVRLAIRCGAIQP